jgi:peptidyl-prolyl cis-trans isomerase SurA
MKKIGLLLLLVTVSTIGIKAQEKEEILLTIGGNKVSLAEFNAIYNKNNTKEDVSQESINEYLDLYIKFKLKVTEAEELGYDTLPQFTKELAGYRKQLAQPYLTDKNVTEDLIKEAYDRMQWDVKASHILVALDAEAEGKDTLEAYNKIIKARNRILTGEDFAKVAKVVSTDPSAQQNGGDLGYFTALQMVYPFETAAYTTKVGDVSMPIRTRFGYHLVKVEDKRTARGTITAAHIMIKSTEKDNDETAKNQEQKINEIYTKLTVENLDFAEMARQFSQDPGSAKRGGELPAFTTGKMVAIFEDAAFGLKADGDISKPFKTQFGWHIAKRVSYKPIASYDDLYATIKAKVARDSRSNKSKEVLLAKIKTDNNYKENLNERNDFYKLVTKDDIKNGTWNPAKAVKYNKLMFGFYAVDGEKMEYTQTDFANYIKDQTARGVKNKSGEVNVSSELNKLYKKIVAEEALKFKDSRLAKTNTEFRLLMQEYRDGILLFDLTDKKVWGKAVKDTTGLQAFYEKNKTNYMWTERVDATTYACSNEAVAKKVAKLVKIKAKKGYTNEAILKMINTDSQLDLTIKEGKFTKEADENVAKATWSDGATSTIKGEKNTVIVVVNKVLPPAAKELKEVRGLVTSDYQNYLEKEWVAELKTKYPVTVNKEVLKLVK